MSQLPRREGGTLKARSCLVQPGVTQATTGMGRSNHAECCSNTCCGNGPGVAVMEGAAVGRKQRNPMVNKPLGSLSILHFDGHGFLDQRVELIHWLAVEHSGHSVERPAKIHGSRSRCPKGTHRLCEVGATAGGQYHPPGCSDTNRRCTPDGHGHDGLRYLLPARQLKKAFLLGQASLIQHQQRLPCPFQTGRK